MKVLESSRVIKSDELWLNTAERSGRSEGYLFVQDGAGAVAGERGEFHFDEHAGRLDKASAGYGDWRVHAKKAVFSGKNTLDYRGANFTSCSTVPPHYHFHASTVHVVPKKHMISYNTSFWIGPVPLFYLPVFYKSLDPDHLVPIKLQPGYDRRNGAFVKGTLFHQFSPTLYNKLYLDYYSAQGFGAGTELQHHDKENRGVLYGYHIRETHSGTERWSVGGDAYQTLVSSLSAQARLQVLSDATFNNNYARSSSFRVTPDLENSGALLFRQKSYNLRLAYQRHDVAAANQIQFIKTTEDYPRLDFQTTQLKLWNLPWLNTFSGFALQNYTQGRPFLQRTVSGSYEATRVFPMGRGFSFTPRAGYTEAWYDRFDQAADNLSTSTFRDTFVGHYLMEGNLRWKTFLGNWDLTETYLRRLRPDSMADDAGAIDHGVETNSVQLKDLFHPTRAVFVRAFSSYDLRYYRDRTLLFHDRLQPIVGEIIYAPRVNFNWSLRDDYLLGTGNRSVIASLLYGNEEKSFIQLASGYNRQVIDRYGADANFALANASATWRVGGALRSQFFTSGGFSGLAARRFQLFEKELSIAHAWHDFFGRALVRFRPGGVREGQVRFELKFGEGKSRSTPPRRDWESEWFPERSAGVHDRP